MRRQSTKALSFQIKLKPMILTLIIARNEIISWVLSESVLICANLVWTGKENPNKLEHEYT